MPTYGTVLVRKRARVNVELPATDFLLSDTVTQLAPLWMCNVVFGFLPQHGLAGFLLPVHPVPEWGNAPSAYARFKTLPLLRVSRTTW